MWSMFKVNNKDTRTMSIAYFTPCSIVSIVNFEQVNTGWIVVHKLPVQSFIRSCSQVGQLYRRTALNNFAKLKEKYLLLGWNSLKDGTSKKVFSLSFVKYFRTVVFEDPLKGCFWFILCGGIMVCCNFMRLWYTTFIVLNLSFEERNKWVMFKPILKPCFRDYKIYLQKRQT